jgi:acetyl-CoA carboxylase biotin carboxyl carrier protein
MSRHEIQAPIPGVFYRRPSPDQPEYVSIGDVVTADSIIGLVEVMKQFAEIKAGAAGTVVSFEINSEDIIGPGDIIAILETDA